MSAINALNIEDYVRGVVAGEMPSGWPQEALRAQAVAARTYALATTKDGDGFDQYADTRSQVYNGIAGETAPTNAAVAATAGEIVTFQGKPIVTYYFSTSGGRTENIENVFLGAAPQPYLVSVDDPYDGGAPRHRWVRQMSLGSAQRAAGLAREGLADAHPRDHARQVAARRARPGRRHRRADERHRPGAAQQARPLRHVGALHGHHVDRQARRRQHAAERAGDAGRARQPDHRRRGAVDGARGGARGRDGVAAGRGRAERARRPGDPGAQLGRRCSAG